jgi:hypothetical protein
MSRQRLVLKYTSSTMEGHEGVLFIHDSSWWDNSGCIPNSVVEPLYGPEYRGSGNEMRRRFGQCVYPQCSRIFRYSWFEQIRFGP